MHRAFSLFHSLTFESARTESHDCVRMEAENKAYLLVITCEIASNVANYGESE